jgi:hypothetical protein
MVGVAADGDRKKRRGRPTARERRALEVGRAFAEIIRDEPVARELWITVDDGRSGVGLWLITDPIDLDKIGELYETRFGRLYERFPEGDFDFIILNPQHTIGDVRRGVPRDAEQIPLRAE